MYITGLSYHDISSRLPADVTIACHNSVDNVTISGPPESINNFTKQLQSEGIFAREVNSSGFAFHSQYIADAGPIFKTQLEKVTVIRTRVCHFIDNFTFTLTRTTRRLSQTRNHAVNDGSALPFRTRCGTRH